MNLKLWLSEDCSNGEGRKDKEDGSPMADSHQSRCGGTMGMDLLDCLKGEEASVGYSWLQEMKSQIIHQDLVLICFFLAWLLLICCMGK
jgi:hypothetical protein